MNYKVHVPCKCKAVWLPDAHCVSLQPRCHATYVGLCLAWWSLCWMQGNPAWHACHVLVLLHCKMEGCLHSSSKPEHSHENLGR